MRNSVCAAARDGCGQPGGAGGVWAHKSKLGVAGAALAVMLFAATGAQAQCVASAGAAPGGFNLAPFAAGGSVNTLLSAINAVNTVFLTESTAFVGSPANQTGGGVWARGVGGEFNTRGTAISTYTVGGAPVAGDIACQTKTQLNFGGVQIGTDISTLNVWGWNLHGGSTLGYLGATGKDDSNPGPVNPFGGSFSDNLQIPFVGLYGAASRGSFFLDGEARWLYFQNAVSDAQNGLFGQHLDARGFAINGDIGYDIALPGNWFIEPSIGVIWSETSVDPLNTAGTIVLPGGGLAPPGVVSISEIYSTIGRASAKVGTTVDAGNLILQPFGVASFFREFEGTANATFNSSFAAAGVSGPSIAGTLFTTGIGNYGQFGVGVAGQIKDTGWLGYIRADYRTGDNINGWSVNGGVRYQFAPEMVAGLPFITKGLPPEAVPVEPAYNWTGFRIGALVGADWGYTNWNFANAGAATSPRFAGILPGGLIGYDYQIGKWVLGAGADMGWTNAHGASACASGFTYFTCENQINWLATATGRLGYTWWSDRILSYAKAGLAVADFEAKIVCNTGSLPSPGCPGQSADKTAAGWTVGLGTEVALARNWSVRSETSYFDLGRDRYQPLTFAGAANPVDVYRKGFVATIGLIYRFDVTPPGAVIAKY